MKKLLLLSVRIFIIVLVADNSYVNIERQYQTESGATSILEARIVAGEEKLYHELLEKIDERISDLRTQMDMGIRSIQSIQKPRMVEIGDNMLDSPDKSRAIWDEIDKLNKSQSIWDAIGQINSKMDKIMLRENEYVRRIDKLQNTVDSLKENEFFLGMVRARSCALDFASFVYFFSTAFKIEKVVGQKYEEMTKAIDQMVQSTRAEVAEKLEQMAQNSRAEIEVLKENQRETGNSSTEVALQDKVSRI